jgi:hypothetical protein
MRTIEKWGPTKPSDVVVGAFYLVKGHGSLGDALPDQVIRILSVPRPAPLYMRSTTVVNAWVFCIIDGFNMMIDYHQHDYPLDAVNVTEHGDHDRHLRRIELDPANQFHCRIHEKCFGPKGVVL